MSQRIAVSKAARLMGIPRGELNKRLLAADIPTFEGEVDLERVKCIAPTLKVEGAGVFDERVRYLRENAAKPKRGGIAPKRDQEAEIRRLSSELIVESQIAEHYRQILEDVGRKLGEMQMSNDPNTRTAAFDMCQWLRARITEA